MNSYLAMVTLVTIHITYNYYQTLPRKQIIPLNSLLYNLYQILSKIEVDLQKRLLFPKNLMRKK